MCSRILPHIEGAGQAPPGVSVIVRWRRPSINDTKTTLKKVCEICHTNGSSMLKYSGLIVPITAPKNVKKKPGNITSTHVIFLKNDGGLGYDFVISAYML